MRRRLFISTSIRRLAISLLLLSSLSAAQAQGRLFTTQKDSIRLFQGFAVSFDLVGADMLAFSDYGQYEGALRVNLSDEWFPIVEIGYGKAERNDEVTHMYYRTAAPYFRVGVDRNLLKSSMAPIVCMVVSAMPIHPIRLISRTPTSLILIGCGIRALV